MLALQQQVSRIFVSIHVLVGGAEIDGDSTSLARNEGCLGMTLVCHLCAAIGWDEIKKLCIFSHNGCRRHSQLSQHNNSHLSSFVTRLTTMSSVMFRPLCKVHCNTRPSADALTRISEISDGWNKMHDDAHATKLNNSLHSPRWDLAAESTAAPRRACCADSQFRYLCTIKREH